MTIDRACSSGLMAVAAAARHIIVDGADVTIGGGIESVSLVMNERVNNDRIGDPWQREHYPEMDDLDDRNGRDRRRALRRQPRMPRTSTRCSRSSAPRGPSRRVATTRRSRRSPRACALQDKATGAVTEREVTLALDEGNRPQTTLEDLRKLKPVFKGGRFVTEGRYITAGNASQLSDGAAALVLTERDHAERRGLEPLGAYRGLAVAGCRPEEMGIGPVLAVPKLLARHGLTVDDIDLWELNEAFASQLLYCRDTARHPERAPERLGRLDRDRSSVRDDGRALHRAPDARGTASRARNTAS